VKLLHGDCVVVQRAISTLDDNDEDSDDVKRPLLNPVIVSMLSLPLLQIVSLPQTATEHCETRDYQLTAKHLLSIIHRYVSQRHHGCHGDDVPGALTVMPSAVSHTCRAYVQLARHLSMDLHRDSVDGDSGVDSVVNRWLQQAHCLLSADLQHSVLLTSLTASLFLLHDDTATVDRCLQLLHAVCQSHNTQVVTVK